MAASFSAHDIAQWFVYWADTVDAEVTNLQVQKLLYYAQGHSLATSGRPLFDEPIEAWAEGPVVVDVYHDLQLFEHGPIDISLYVPEELEWDVFEPFESILTSTWDTYGSLATSAPRDSIHLESPWKETFEATGNNVIPLDRLGSFFSHKR
ncbi:Panacea domain-containing protein [Nocardia pseudovaccinii]|uniref:Panacea domain-containing protein n=1 Tax=Nocardia pseudovaccinii TaxID=189540 RepID=UPI0007A44F24|nr:type II toxin-antitoxin system antitoxin SocA domain-containing protein [Nocardia pseudovaccinii]